MCVNKEDLLIAREGSKTNMTQNTFKKAFRWKMNAKKFLLKPLQDLSMLFRVDRSQSIEIASSLWVLRSCQFLPEKQAALVTRENGFQAALICQSDGEEPFANSVGELLDGAITPIRENGSPIHQNTPFPPP